VSWTTLILIVCGIGAAALAGAAFFRSGAHDAGDIPVVVSDPRPIRVAPENPGGLRPDDMGERMFTKDHGSDTVHLAPPPEIPQAKPR
jgi:hypothetical protein